MIKKPFLLKIRWLLVAAVLLFVLALLANRKVHLLLIDDVQASHPVFTMKVKPGDLISLGFMHSVEHCQVWDHLQIDESYGLVVVATEFAESRTGLPYAAFDGEVFERLKDSFRISNMHRKVPEIYQWVDSRYDNEMKINGDSSIALASLAGNTLLHISIAKRTTLEWVFLKARLLWPLKRF